LCGVSAGVPPGSSRVLAEHPEYLSPEYTPDELPHRERDVENLSFYFESRLLRGVTPPHILITGPSGSGKTATVKHVLARYTVPGFVAYTVATGSGVKVLRSCASEVGVKLPVRGLSLDEAWERFSSEVGGALLVVVLDEIDKMLAVEPDAPLLYYLSRRPRTWVIGLSNNYGALSLVKDERVLSSFNPWRMVFDPYTVDQVRDILQHRVKLAGASVKEEAVGMCAAVSVSTAGGDVRYALNLLSSAVQLAEKAGDPAVEERHVEAAKEEVERGYILRSLTALQPAHKLLLLKGVYEQRISSPSQLYEYTNTVARQLGLSVYTYKRLSEFLNSLHVEGWVKITRRGAAGRRGVLWEVQPTEEDAELVKTTIDKLLAQL